MAFKSQRWTLANMLPVFFMAWVIGTIWILYVSLHLFYLTQVYRPQQPGQENVFDPVMFNRGIVHTVISQFLTFMMAICCAMAISTDPGSVPESPEWMPDLASRRGRPATEPEAESLAPSHHEVKNSGGPRFCKWCNCFKPDRCHHCRVCRSCILRMDHHCPWIANCVGYKNHKYFMLLGFYGVSCCVFIACTMYETMHRALVEETTFVRRFFVVFGMTLSVMIGTILSLFFSLHVWLMIKATTTIELCEKAYKRNERTAGSASIYDLGAYRNMCDVLGSSPLVWLIPWIMPAGDGLQFSVRQDLSQRDSGETARGSPSTSRPTADRDDSPQPEVTGQTAADS
eukprot:TRINITY_DN74108_c0_g1_i1.p1 TRINITY_DN74108_c0_g1~~TRINITY_DN74108_c0_g1_i1.p1  ORF type:complete len:343 (+),score=25.70 TRINITY_DN74108_c0_g1_i1:165-1193(+)